MRNVSLLLFLFTLSFGCSKSKDDSNLAPQQNRGLNLEKDENEVRKSLKMPTKAEAAAATVRLKRKDLISEYSKKNIRCLYIAQKHTRGFLDKEGKMWEGTSYHGGLFPVLEKVGNYIKTVSDDDEPEGSLHIIYFERARLTHDPQKTDWVKNGESTVGTMNEWPELCPNK